MKTATKRRIRFFSWILFVMYLLLMIYLCFLSEDLGRTGAAEREYRYNLVPFTEIRRFWIYWERVGFWKSFINLAGNVLAFLPFGFFLPILSRRVRRGVRCIFSGFLLSLMIETIQLVTKVGCFDVDDLMLNTLGAAVGYLMFVCANEARRWFYEKKI